MLCLRPGQEGGPPARASDAGLPHWWLEHARRDLALAKLAHESELDFAEPICFHAQQAAEKAVKAVLLDRNVDFPNTHDLGKLVEEVTGRGLALTPNVGRAEELTRYASETRYPHSQEITDENISDALLIAEATVEWAAGLLRAPEEPR